MPKEMEQALKKKAADMASKGKLRRKVGESLQEAQDRFTYGILRKRGWKPKREVK